ncbi:hypothetical protein [Bacillus cereus]|uniref:hypothetical protein n=1 Tax=Bacillus cereus TaxID=1396 RepID=UPI0002DC43AB|nr:hypothetical protein [Bacillus cereus]
MLIGTSKAQQLFKGNLHQTLCAENDDRFFREFISGRHSFEVYSVQEKIEKHDELEKNATIFKT